MDLVPEKVNTQNIPVKTPPVRKEQAPKGSEIKRIAKRTSDNLNTPSIKDALQGKFAEKQISAKEQHQMYSNSDQMEDFTVEELKLKWDAFLSRLDDRPNLQSTLSYLPEIKEDFQLYLEIENTVQEDLINSVKPELISWLRRELKNSKIQLITEITEKIKGRIIYSDAEKFEELAKKNDDLKELKKRFNLDFGQ